MRAKLEWPLPCKLPVCGEQPQLSSCLAFLRINAHVEIEIAASDNNTAGQLDGESTVSSPSTSPNTLGAPTRSIRNIAISWPAPPTAYAS
jgi:hypothetical protein